MNRQPWTGTTRVGAAHEPQVKRRQKTAKEEADAKEAEYQAVCEQIRISVWGRP